MRALLQRVARAQGTPKGASGSPTAIGPGVLLLVGFEESDSVVSIEQFIHKLKSLRIFSDAAGKMNLPAQEVGGQYLIVSQFTLYADLKYGNRPSFTKAAPKTKAAADYDLFVATARRVLGEDRVRWTPFGSDLEVELVNDGPVTLWLDSKELF